MAIKGLDTTSNVTKILDTIKSQGYSFVVRYYSKSGNSKRMSVAESSSIIKSDLKLVVVYENLHNAYSKFNASIAETDAIDAINQAKAHGQPSSTIYFAVDYDASESQIDANIKKHSAGYSVGVYGSTLVCKKLKTAGIVSKTWVANASNWGYGTTFSDYNIKQQSQITVGGILFDKDVATSITSIGAW